jgi:hypothetical protein
MRSMVEGGLAQRKDPSTIHSSVNGSPPHPGFAGTGRN